MKVLFYCCGSENLGVEALSAYLKQHGHTVELLFDPQLGNNFYIHMPWLNRLISYDLLIKKAKQFEPELIAISFMTNQFLAVRTFMNLLRHEIDVPVIAGGVHASILPDELIKESWVDMLCIGEGEECLLEVAETIEKRGSFDRIKNLWFKDKIGNIIKNPIRSLVNDLDTFPIPDKMLFNKYGVISKRLIVMTARGCPYHCTYCINSFRNELYKGEKYLRRKSVDSSIRELEYYKAAFNPSFILFYDDVFTYDIQWLEAFSEEYKKKIGLPYECYITPTKASDKVIELLKRSGCESVIMGVQSGSESVRKKLLDRHYTNQMVEEVSQLLKKQKIRLITEYIYGFPDDNFECMLESFKLNDKLNAAYTGSFIFYPFPKTFLTQYSLAHSYLSESNYERVKKGESSMHSLNTMIDGIDKDMVYKFYAILPLYNKSNKILKKLLLKQLEKDFGFLHKLINIISIPLLDMRYVFSKFFSIPLIIYKTRIFLKKN